MFDWLPQAADLVIGIFTDLIKRHRRYQKKRRGRVVALAFIADEVDSPPINGRRYRFIQNRGR